MPQLRRFDYIYWSNSGGGTIGCALRDGSWIKQSFISGPDAAWGVAANQQFVFWAIGRLNSNSLIARANLNGSEVDVTFIDQDIGVATGMAADDQHVYWTNLTEPNGTIGRVNIDGTNVNKNFITGANQPDAVTVDAHYVYWSNRGAGNAIGRANLNGSGVQESFITLRDNGYGIATNSEYIYWSNQLRNAIGRAKLDGTGINEYFITGVDAAPEGLAVDGEYIYWANYNSGSIGRAKLDGHDVNEGFITGANSPFAIALASVWAPPVEPF
jgi:virginiamycin B lyase